MTHTALLAATLAWAVQPAIPVPPGATRVISYDRWGAQLAICAELPRGEAVLMQRNGRKLPPTHIFVMDEGSDVVRKVVTGLGGCDPAWSPDGKWLAFTAPDGVWVIALAEDTGERIVDTTLEGEDYSTVEGVSWSPDGERLAYLEKRGPRNTRLHVVATDGTVTFTSPAPEPAPAMEWTAPRTLLLAGRTITVR